jgi:hypothetical protein
MNKEQTLRTDLGYFLQHLAPSALAALHHSLTEIARAEPEGAFVLGDMAEAVQYAGENNCGDDFLEMIGAQ